MQLTQTSPEVHRRGALAAPLASAAALMLLTGISMSAFGEGTPGSERLSVEDVVDGVMLMSFPVVGALLVHRSRGGAVGWLMCFIGVAVGASYLAGGYASHDLPGRALASLLAEVGFVVVVTVAMTFLILRFPDGELPSSRWRPVQWLSWTALVISALCILVAPGPVDEDVPNGLRNPLGVEVAEPAIAVLEPLGLLAFVIAALLSLASLILRLRGAQGAARRQIRVLGIGAATLVTLFLLDSTLQSIGGDWYGVLSAVIAVGAIPVSVAVALLGVDPTKPQPTGR